MRIRHPKAWLQPLLHVARSHGTERYFALYAELEKALRSTPTTPISFEMAMLIARAVLLGQPIQAVTYICVSDYVGDTRYKLQRGSYALTPKERLMFERVQEVRDCARRNEVQFAWRLILADGWGRLLYGDRVVPGALDAYCAMMQAECRERGFDAVAWTQLMSTHKAAYEEGKQLAEADAERLKHWEAAKGEIAHDKPNPSKALELAKGHIMMRAAEAFVVTKWLGPTVVLSTETKKLVRYDNLVVPRERYCHCFTMPFFPHRLDT